MTSDFRHEYAEFATHRAQGVAECIDVLQQPEKLRTGWWVVVADFAGRVRGWRFENVERKTSPDGGESVPRWLGPAARSWRSTLTRGQYVAGVREIQRRIEAQEIQQANLARILHAPLAAGEAVGDEPSAAGLYQKVVRHHGAPASGCVHVGEHRGERESIWLVSASPEVFFTHDGDSFRATPIKGTGRTSADIAGKDEVESHLVASAMADEFREVPSLQSIGVTGPQVVQHPGLVHLVRTVSGQFTMPRPGKFWRELFSRCSPPITVAGVPRTSTKTLIAACEPFDRGPYCGVFGWVDGDNDRSQLAVTIRSFWWARGVIRFGTGAGITAGSVPETEWEETQLKARRLLRLASS